MFLQASVHKQILLHPIISPPWDLLELMTLSIMGWAAFSSNSVNMCICDSEAIHKLIMINKRIRLLQLSTFQPLLSSLPASFYQLLVCILPCASATLSISL